MKTHPSPRTQHALTLVEVLVVMAAIALLALVFLPKLPKACCKAQRISCVNNLKQVGLAFRIWAGDSADRFPMRVSVTNGGTMEWVASGTVWPHFQVISNELNTTKVINCPTDPQYYATNWTVLANSNISYFIGVDATENEPTTLLTGDDNLVVGRKPVGSGLLNLWTNSDVGWSKLRHQKNGNICLADGSVLQVNSEKLRQVLANTGVATNRLAIP